MENTKIEWADHTENFWTGCEAVGPGCINCYAETWAKRAGRDFAIRVRTSDAIWRKPIKKWNAEPFYQCKLCSNRYAESAAQGERCPRCVSRDRELVRPRVFTNSLADFFDNKVDPQVRLDALDVIRQTQNLDWMILTKRIGNARRLLEEAFDLAARKDQQFLAHWLSDWVVGKPPGNVWLGATVVNQEEADRDVFKLLRTPAARRFLSIEPMLGPIDLRYCTYKTTGDKPHGNWFDLNLNALTGFYGTSQNSGEHGPAVDWVIGGFESGPHARPGHPDWALALRDQCADPLRGKRPPVAFLWKQNGEWAAAGNPAFYAAEPKDARTAEINIAGEFEEDAHEGITVRRVGKERAGRLLGGRHWDGYPTSALPALGAK